MRAFAFTLAALLCAAQAHAACNTAPGVGIETIDTVTEGTGDDAFLGIIIFNNDTDSGCGARTFCFKSWNVSTTPGRPSPNYITVSPSPAAPACQALAPQQELFGIINVTTATNTPAFKYNIRTDVTEGGVLKDTAISYVNVQDAWGNTCQQ